MKINRREAIKGVLATAGALSAGVNLSAQSVNGHESVRYPLGLQFFTLTGRERPLAWGEFSGLMATAHNIGYEYLEMSPLYGHDPELIRAKAQDLGLTIPSFHMGFDQMLDFMAPGDLTARNAQDAVYTPLGIVQLTRINVPIALEMGCGLGVIAASGVSNFKTLDSIKLLCDAFNQAAEIGKKGGLKVGYHMHATDFIAVEGQMPFKIMLDNTTPDMQYELDVCWAADGGATPQDLIREYHDRIIALHLKDLTKDRKIATPGDGIIDFVAIHDACAKLSKDAQYYVERDQAAPGTNVNEATRGFKYLQSIGWGPKPS